MGQVVRSPAESTGEEDGDVEATDDLRVGELLRKEVEREREDSADEESEDQDEVRAILAVHLRGAKGTPDDRGGEEGRSTGAVELGLSFGRANALDTGDLPVENSHGDAGRHDGRNGLSNEHNTWRDLAVVPELQVLGEGDGTRSGDEAV